MSNKKEIFSIRKLKNGRSDSVKIGTLGLIMGAAIALSVNTQSVEAAIIDNGDGTTTISNSKGSITVDTAHVKFENTDYEYDYPSKDFDPNPKPNETGTDNITKIGKVDYKYVSTDGTVLEEDKNQDAGFEKQISVDYEVYGPYGKVFKSLTGNEITDTDLTKAKEHGAAGKDTIEKNNTTYHKIGDPAVEITGDGGGVYSDSTLGNVTAKLTSEGLVQNDGKINHSGVKPGGRSWIVEETGKGTYGKYVLADTPATTSDKWLEDTFKAGEATAKDYTSTNIATDGGVKEGDYVFVLEKNTFVTGERNKLGFTYVVNFPTANNISTLHEFYEAINAHKDNPDDLSHEGTRTFLKGYLAYIKEKGLQNTEGNMKRYLAFSYLGQPGVEDSDKEDILDSEKRPATATIFDPDKDIIVGNESGGDEEDGYGLYFNLTVNGPATEKYNYRTAYTPLRAYRLGSGHTTITYTYSPEVTSRSEKKGSVTVHYQTEDGTTLKSSYNDTVDAVVEVETKTYYLDANNQEVVVNTSKNTENVTYNTKENDTEKPQRLEANGSVYYIKENGTKTTVNGVPQTSPAEEGPVVEGTTEVTYVYEKAGSVIVNYKTEDGTALTGTVVGDESKTVASGTKDVDNGKPGEPYNTADNGMKPTRVKTAEGKVYKLVEGSTEGEETGTVVAGETKQVTYVYKEVTGDVVVHYVDTEGHTIAADKDDLKGASLSEKYDTAVDNKPEKITAEDGTVYYITKAGLKDGSKPETGDVVEGTTEVTYVYEKAGSVVVHYVDTEGHPLQGTNENQQPVTQTVTDTDNAKAGSDYDTQDHKPTSITTAEGKVYKLVPQSTTGNETGKVVAGQTLEVTYVYQEAKGNVIVKFQDTEGNPIADDENDETNASLNTNYNTSEHKKATIVKDGVTYYLTDKALKDGSKPEEGPVVEGTTEVTYVYEKAGSVVVHYTDQEGNPISGTDPEGNNVPETNNDTTDGRPGSDYDTSDNGMKPNRIKTSEGKVYELVPASTIGEETGKVVAGDTVEVTYVYKEVKGNVVVKYEDTEGNPLAADEQDETDASLNVKYDTADHKKDEITKDGVKYYLTAKALKDGSKETGDVVEGTTEVTYVYEKAGSVLVHYVDTEGNPLQGTNENQQPV
ncbi:MucBP domain-containing protein, partial [Streptococcus sp. 53]|uniref:MucBP domain-containing protein n=1 Tax=Streptococcus sp. 53 TaxID=2582679 RepID=UPI0031F4717E